MFWPPNLAGAYRHVKRSRHLKQRSPTSTEYLAYLQTIQATYVSTSPAAPIVTRVTMQNFFLFVCKAYKITARSTL